LFKINNNKRKRFKEWGDLSREGEIKLIKVLIAEEQGLFCDGLSAIIERTDDMKVIGNVDDGLKAIDRLKEIKPDVVLMNSHMPNMDGIKVTVYIKQHYPDIKVVLLTDKVEENLVIRGVNAGVDGFLLKALYAECLVDSIRMVMQGEVVFSGDVARILANRIRDLSHNKKQLFRVQLERLGYDFTDRKIDIAYLLAEGHSNQQIASKLFLSEGTVKNYISEIYNELNIHNRKKAITFLQQVQVS